MQWVTSIFNGVIREGKIPADWRKSWLVNVYKGKGDALACGSYRGIKLLDQVMKILERVLEKRIRERVSLRMKCSLDFDLAEELIDAIFIVRQIQEKYLAKKKELWMAFVDLEKTFDRMLREIVWWALRVVGVEWIVKAIQAMYDGATTAFRLRDGKSKEFGVKVGVHQGSILSPLLFTIVLEALSREFRCGLLCRGSYSTPMIYI